jgi:hypothetical protein
MKDQQTNLIEYIRARNRESSIIDDCQEQIRDCMRLDLEPEEAESFETWDQQQDIKTIEALCTK